MKPAEGLVICPLKSCLFKILYEEVGSDGSVRTHSHTISLLAELPSETEKGSVRTQ
jgi:hypothetical protein